jgi:hypothetical protein
MTDLLWARDEHLGRSADFPALRGNRAPEARGRRCCRRPSMPVASNRNRRLVKTATGSGVSAVGSELVTRPTRCTAPADGISCGGRAGLSAELVDSAIS